MPPTIEAQPANATVIEGQPVSFVVAATGTPAPSYQWQLDGTSIWGATSATYTINQPQPGDAGTYTVVVSNGVGAVTSTPATLTLISDSVRFTGWQYLTHGQLKLTLIGQVGHNYTLQASTNLATWSPLATFACTNWTMEVFDPEAKEFVARFYRLSPPVPIPGMRPILGLAPADSTKGPALTLTASAGLQYRIEASGDLANWTAITNFLSTGPTTYFRDSSATTHNQRFYRAVMP